MRTIIVSTSILLISFLVTGTKADVVTVPVILDPNSTEKAETIIIVVQSTEPPKVITEEPTTNAPIETTTSNPNISFIDAQEQKIFLDRSNKHRDQHLIGRFGFVWSWDDALVDSAISRIAETCDIKVDNTDTIRELILNSNEWKRMQRDKQWSQPQMIQEIYQSGSARVGCIGRINCDNSGGVNDDKLYLCHFAKSNFTTDAQFSKGAEGCVNDKAYSNLCIDAPKEIVIESTPAPVKYVYLRGSGSRFGAFLALSMMASVVIYGI